MCNMKSVSVAFSPLLATVFALPAESAESLTLIESNVESRDDIPSFESIFFKEEAGRSLRALEKQTEDEERFEEELNNGRTQPADGQMICPHTSDAVYEGGRLETTFEATTLTDCVVRCQHKENCRYVSWSQRIMLCALFGKQADARDTFYPGLDHLFANPSFEGLGMTSVDVRQCSASVAKYFAAAWVLLF